MSLVKKTMKIFSLDTVVYKYTQKNPDKFITLKDEDIYALQRCLLEMLLELDNTCQMYNLEYALIGGNVLGKIRHNGFIPWDYDVDVIMFREDYDKFKKIFYKSKLCKKYVLRGPGCKDGADYRCMKIYKKDTVMRPILSKKNAENKIFIDVMPVDNVPDSLLRRQFKAFHCNFLIAILGCCEFRNNTNELLKKEMKRTLVGKLNFLIRNLIASVFLIVPLEKWYQKFDKASIYLKKTKDVTIVNGKLLYMGEIAPIDMFYPFHRCEYEGINTWIINRPKDYLKHRYGKYEIIPHKEDRESHCVEELKI